MRMKKTGGLLWICQANYQEHLRSSQQFDAKSVAPKGDLPRTTAANETFQGLSGGFFA
jgi:hypothetical protein